MAGRVQVVREGRLEPDSFQIYSPISLTTSLRKFPKITSCCSKDALLKLLNLSSFRQKYTPQSVAERDVRAERAWN